MKRILALFLSLAGCLSAQQSVTVLNNGSGTGTFNTPGINYYLWGPPGATVDFSNVTTKGITGGPVAGVSQLIAGTNVTLSPMNGLGVVTVNASAGGSTSPGGSNTDVQFNNTGSFGGSSSLNWNGNQLEAISSNSGPAFYAKGSSSPGASGGMIIQAGTNSSDYSQMWDNAAGAAIGKIDGAGQLHLPGFYSAAGPIVSDAGGNFTVGTSSTSSVANIAALKALATAGLSTGAQVSVGGYYANGDGGGGLFIYNSSSSAADNGGSVIEPTTTSGRWLRSWSGPVNVLWFGAYGNDSNNDTTAIQNAITVGATSGGIYLPGGHTYLVTHLNLTGLASFTMQGDNFGYNGSATIITSATAGANILDFTGSAAIQVMNLYVTAANGTTANSAIYLYQTSGSNAFDFENVNVYGSFTTAAFFDYAVPSNYAHDCTFTNANASPSNPCAALWLSEASEFTFVGCYLDDNTSSGFGHCAIMDSAAAISWSGGNMQAVNANSTTTDIVQFLATYYGSQKIFFEGVTMGGTSNLTPYTFNNAAASYVSILNVANCVINQATSVFYGVTGSTYSNLTFRGTYGTGGMFFTGGNMTISYSDIQCGGGSVNVGAGGTIASSVLFNPGTVTAGTDTSTHIASSGVVSPTFTGAGAMTTLSASSTVSGSGFSTYLASPPAIGGTAPAAGSFTTLTDTTALGISYGGTGQTTKAPAFNALSPLTTLGDTLYGGASGAGTRLAGNITVVPQVLVQTGSGAASAAPVLTNYNVNAMNDYASGSWTPTLNSYTIVNGTGGITSTGTYVKIGNLVWASCIINGTGSASVASVASTSNITGLPYANNVNVSGTVSDGGTGALGNGVVTVQATTIYTPTWSATTPASVGAINITAVYATNTTP